MRERKGLQPMKSQVFIVSTNEICRLTRGLTSELSFALHDSNPLKNVERKEYDQSFLLRYAMYHVLHVVSKQILTIVTAQQHPNHNNRTLVGLRLSNCWEFPNHHHHRNLKLLDRAEKKQHSENKSY